MIIAVVLLAVGAIGWTIHARDGAKKAPSAIVAPKKQKKAPVVVEADKPPTATDGGVK